MFGAKCIGKNAAYSEGDPLSMILRHPRRFRDIAS